MKSHTALLDVKLLRLLDLLYSTRSVTRAALQLGQSQPTVSIGLARLRKQFADPLFVRTPQGMQPTPRADELIGSAREVLGGLRKLSASQQYFDAPQAQREFRIFMSDAAHITLLPTLYAHVRALAPQVRLVAATVGADMPTALQNGQADLALGFMPGLEAGFYQQTFYNQDWVCLINPRHPRIGVRFSLKQYASEAHVGIVSGTGHQLLEQALKEQGIARHIQLKLPGFLGLTAILSASDLVATLPRQMGESLAAAAGLRALPCPLKIEGFNVKQYWHERYHHDAANRWLRNVCADLFQRKR